MKRFSPKLLPIHYFLLSKKSKGFTLVELLIAIAVVGILATVLIVAVNPAKQLQKSRDTGRKAALKTLQTALEQYYQDNGNYPVSATNPCVSSYTTGCWMTTNSTPSNNLLGPYAASYIKAMPSDPSQNGSNCANGGGSHRILAYSSPAGGASYIISARLENLSDPQVTSLPSGSTCIGHNYYLTNQQ